MWKHPYLAFQAEFYICIPHPLVGDALKKLIFSWAQLSIIRHHSPLLKKLDRKTTIK